MISPLSNRCWGVQGCTSISCLYTKGWCDRMMKCDPLTYLKKRSNSLLCEMDLDFSCRCVVHVKTKTDMSCQVLISHVRGQTAVLNYAVINDTISHCLWVHWHDISLPFISPWLPTLLLPIQDWEGQDNTNTNRQYNANTHQHTIKPPNFFPPKKEHDLCCSYVLDKLAYRIKSLEH